MGAKRLNAKLTDFNSPSGALLHFKIIKILVGNRKPPDLSINVRSACNVASVKIYNVMRNINWIDKRSKIKCSGISIISEIASVVRKTLAFQYALLPVTE